MDQSHSKIPTLLKIFYSTSGQCKPTMDLILSFMNCRKYNAFFCSNLLDQLKDTQKTFRSSLMMVIMEIKVPGHH